MLNQTKNRSSFILFSNATKHAIYDHCDKQPIEIQNIIKHFFNNSNIRLLQNGDVVYKNHSAWIHQCILDMFTQINLGHTSHFILITDSIDGSVVFHSGEYMSEDMNTAKEIYSMIVSVKRTMSDDVR